MENVNKIVENYFKENNIKDLMQYGSDAENSLNSISKMYENLLNKLNIKNIEIYTENVSDGKYKTLMKFGKEHVLEIYTKAWNDMKIVSENLSLAKEFYERSFK